VNKKAKDKAIATILSKKLLDDEIIFIDSLAMNAPKTSEIKDILAKIATAEASFATLSTKKHNAALIITPGHEKNIILSTRNFQNIEVQTVASINPVIISKYKYLIIASPKESVDLLVERLQNGKDAKAEAAN